MHKKKVLFLLEGFDKGGIEKVTLDIVNNLDPNKYDITVKTFWYGGYCQSLVNENIKVMPFFFKRHIKGINRLIDYLSPSILYRLFIHGNYDVEIAASDGGAAKVISGSNNKKAKKICWVHMDVVSRGSKLKEFTDSKTAKHIYNKFDLIVPVSDTCGERFEEKFGKIYPIKVCKNPLPIDEIRKKSKMDDSLIKRNDNKISFVCVGRLVQQKGFDRLLGACVELLNEGLDNFSIYIIGDGPERLMLNESIYDKKLESYVELCGFSENPYSSIKTADAFLLTSRDEAFPLVVGESLVIGTPVIATNCSGVSEWLEQGKYGVIIDNSTEGIIDGMRRVLINPGILEDYRKKILHEMKNMNFEEQLKCFEDLL